MWARVDAVGYIIRKCGHMVTQLAISLGNDITFAVVIWCLFFIAGPSSRSLAEIVGSNPTELHGCLL